MKEFDSEDELSPSETNPDDEDVGIEGFGVEDSASPPPENPDADLPRFGNDDAEKPEE